jgi:hypothetical protein
VQRSRSLLCLLSISTEDHQRYQVIANGRRIGAGGVGRPTTPAS